MKINLTHAAVTLGLVALAYMYGKKRAAAKASTSADSNIQNQAEWWSYPGLWSAQ